MRQIKGLLLIMIFIMLLFGESLLQAQCLFNNYTTKKSEIPLKGVGNGTKGDLVMRNATIQYPKAFICNKNISIFFPNPMKEVRITVKNLNTAQIIYSEKHDVPSNVNIQLDAGGGNFQIIIISDNIELFGDFTF